MGHEQNTAFAEYPLLRSLYEAYCLCRAQQFVNFRRPEQGGRERMISIIFTTGLSLLPVDGGVDDQSYVTMRIFAAFLRGEREGQLRLMQR